MRHHLFHDHTDLGLDKAWAFLQDQLPGSIAAMESLIPPPDAEV